MQATHAQFQSIRIVLADDHDLVRCAIKALLVQIPGVTVVAEARDGHELIAAVERLQPDIVMTDISMPGMDGLSAVAKLHAQCPKVRLVILSAHDALDLIKQAVANGACGYLTKDASTFELARALTNVMSKGSYFGSAIAHRLLQPGEAAVCEDLTARQVEILKLLAQGFASKEIAFKLGVSSKTVDVHRSRVMARLGLHDLSSLTRYAIRTKLIEA